MLRKYFLMYSSGKPHVCEMTQVLRRRRLSFKKRSALVTEDFGLSDISSEYINAADETKRDTTNTVIIASKIHFTYLAGSCRLSLAYEYLLH